ncbi:hypothetical protein J0S82_016439, partial [Galemys pyrenaicus]
EPSPTRSRWLSRDQDFRLSCAKWTLPSPTTRVLLQWVSCDRRWPRKFCSCVAPSPVRPMGATEKEEQSLLQRLSKKDFRVTGCLQVLSLPPPSLRRQTSRKACRCPLCLSSSCLLKTGVPSLPLKSGLQFPMLRPLSEKE